MQPKNSADVRAIIAALVSAKATNTDARLREATAVLNARGIQVVGTVVQRRGVSRSNSPGGSKRTDAPMNPATLIGAGKVQDLALLAKERNATVVYFLNELSLSQAQRLAALTRCSVISSPNLGR